jgi:predicted nucleotidyltransferase
LQKEKTLISFGQEPLKVEMLTTIKGVIFGKCYKRRNIIVIDGIPIAFINLNDLIKNKRATGRPQDINDLVHLTKSRKTVSRQKKK